MIPNRLNRHYLTTLLILPILSACSEPATGAAVPINLLELTQTENFTYQKAEKPATEFYFDPIIGQLTISAPEKGRSEDEFRLLLKSPVKAGELCLIRLELKAVPHTGQSEAGQGGLKLTIASVDDPGNSKIEYDNIHFRTLALAPQQSQTFESVFVAERDMPAGKTVLSISKGVFTQPVAVSRIEFLNYGADARVEDFSIKGIAYPGHESDAAWRNEADARIREHRMANLSVRVVDSTGEPIADARVKVAMQRHAYLFGTCIKAARVADFMPQDIRDRPGVDYQAWLADNAIYREKLENLFNFVVFENDMKWPQWAGERGFTTQKSVFDAIDWLESKNMLIKGHTMVWGSRHLTATTLHPFLGSDHDKAQQIILNHIADIGTATRESLAYMDVLNEPIAHTEILKLLGQDRVAEWFKAADRAMPDTRLVVNDFDIVGNGGSEKQQDRFADFIQDMLNRDAPIDVLGFQSHFWSPRVTPPEKLYRIIVRFAELGLPLMVSEFDMNIQDENLQADYTRDFLKVWFSHPATEAYIMWGFWAKAHWMGERGAIYRQDWSPKPNLNAYTDLVLNEWWTAETLTTNMEGHADTRGFLGDYSLSITAQGYTTAPRTISLSKDGLSLTVVLYEARDDPE